MILTLELSPAEEAALAAQAQARNQKITDRAREILSTSLGLADPPAQMTPGTPTSSAASKPPAS